MDATKLAPHETLALRELLSGEINAVKKLNTGIPMVQDDDLKYFMKKSLDAKKSSIKTIQQFINNQSQSR